MASVSVRISTPSESDLPLVGRGWYWQEFEVGTKFRTVGKTLRDADIMHLVHATTLHEVLFTNQEYVAKESVIKGRFAPGPLIYLMAESLIMPSIQMTALAFLDLHMSSKQPLKVGETMHVEVEVTEARAAQKKGRGMVRTTNTVLNQRGEILQVYKALRLIKSKPGV